MTLKIQPRFVMTPSDARWRVVGISPNACCRPSQHGLGAGLPVKRHAIDIKAPRRDHRDVRRVSAHREETPNALDMNVALQ